MRRSWISNPDQTRLWDDPSWYRCERLIKAFEEAWRKGACPTITEYLGTQGPERLALLVELAHVDMEFRLKAGESVRTEAYLAAHPELAADRSATLGLLVAEFKLRQAQPGGARLEEYALRFPEHVADLSGRLLPGHGADLPDHPPSQLGDTPDPSGDKTCPLTSGGPSVPGYEILGMLGHGGMGVVYKAREANLGRLVALKFLPADYAQEPARLERFLREARTTSALNHPHICTIHALGQHEGRPFIVMEFIEGRTLRALAAPHADLEEAARLIGQAARALAAAHAAGVVHRDIKPENIMMRADGYVKVLDFGLARRLPTLAQFDPGGEHDTDPGALLGTLAYMSPEQTNDAAVDSASDIFSLGIVFYQLVTGQHPFEDSSAVGMLHAIAARHPVPPSRLNPEVPVPLERLIGAMLHKDARLRLSADEVVAALTALACTSDPPAVPAPVPRLIVPRRPELATLRAAFDKADAGHGAMICMAGEPGIGKTTLVEDFLGGLEAEGRPCLIARGHCSERLAAAEAYLPVIDALANLLRAETSGTLARLMKVVAASWYSQVAHAEGVRRQESGISTEAPATPSERAPSQQALLREFCILLQEASRRCPVVLFFDDVHWADISTVDLLAHVGRQGAGLRVLVIVTYRPTELLLGPHPFHHVKLELQGKRVCTELVLDFLSRDDIGSYLALAFPGHALPGDFADLVHARTEGSPLFMVDLLRYLRERGVITEADGRWTLARELPDLWQELPESVRSMVQRKLERLAESDRRLLAVASVQGAEFDSAMVAGALKLDAAKVEERLQTLERVYGLVRLVRESEFPDRTLTLRYGFVHILYQQALYAELPPSRRAALSAALARSLESHHGPACPVVAAELACLYEVGRDFGHAAVQFHRAAQNAARLFAHRDAVALAQRGLRLLQALPDTPERAALELPLQTTLGLQLQVSEGYAAPAAKLAYERARELCPQVPGSAPFAVLWGLWLCAKVGSELRSAQEMADELLVLARRQNDPGLALQAFQALGMTAFCRGEQTATLRHVEQAMALYDPSEHHTHSFQFGQDPGVICKAFGAVALWLLGCPDEAVRHSEAAIRMSQGLSPTCQAVALHFAAMLHQLRRDIPQTRVYAEATSTLAAEHGLLFWMAGGTILAGWARAMDGAAEDGIAQLRQGLADWQATGSVTYLTYYLGLLAEALSVHGQAEEAGRVLEEAIAFVLPTGEGLYEAELHRLRGALRLRGTAAPGSAVLQQADADCRHALEIARRQRAKSLELRAALSLACLERHQGKPDEARKAVAETLAWFTEGLQTPDLREAKEILESCPGENRFPPEL